jgi:N-acetylmuramoyl-L-alanine amidase
MDCLDAEYHKATDLPRHYASITRAMLNYHNFREKAATTPAAIIELGFMGSDRELLVNGRDRLARGIFNGLLCFLEK